MRGFAVPICAAPSNYPHKRKSSPTQTKVGKTSPPLGERSAGVPGTSSRSMLNAQKLPLRKIEFPKMQGFKS